jgi:hypothetical protein
VISLAIGFSIGERFTHVLGLQATLAMLYLALFGSVVAYSACLAGQARASGLGHQRPMSTADRAVARRAAAR